ncbi:MAG: DUF3137 domain-containing protein [Acidobacteriota bacterium]
MSLITWLIEPIRETYRLAPHDLIRRGPGSTEGPRKLEGDTFEKLEQQRLAALRHRRRSLLVGVPTVPVLSAATYWIANAWGENRGDAIVWAITALVLAGLALRIVAEAGLWIFRKTAKDRVLSVMAAEKGLEYRMEGVGGGEIDVFEEQGLFGSSTNSGDDEDAFSGEIEGVEILLFEARRLSVSRSKEGSSKSLVFHGLCLRLSFPKRFSGTTRVLSDFGVLNKLHEVGNSVPLKRVKLEDPRFEKEFEALSTDQVEARYLLTPALMERLVEAQSVMGKRTRLRAAFHDRHMLLTLDTQKNRSLWARMRGNLNQLHHFEIGDTSRPVEEMDMTHQFEKEMAVIQEIVGTLNINMKTRI